MKELYISCIGKLSSEYRAFRETISLIQSHLSFQDEEGLYESLKTDVRIKAMNAITSFQSGVASGFGREAVDRMYEEGVFKGVRELNMEVFGCGVDVLNSTERAEEDGMVNIIA